MDNNQLPPNQSESLSEGYRPAPPAPPDETDSPAAKFPTDEPSASTPPPPPEPAPMPEEPTELQISEQLTAEMSESPMQSGGKVQLPGPEDDEELDREVKAALGDFSLLDLYDQVEPNRLTSARKQPKSISAEALAAGVRRGKIISITAEDIFVDMGGKSQGLLPREELDEGEEVEVGGEIDVVILRYDAKDGLLILSKKTAERQLLLHHLKEGSLVEARAVADNKGGLEMDIKGIPAFMPISQIDLERVEDLKPFVGQKFICEVVEVEKGDKNIVLSRRNVLVKERQERQEQLWAELEKGQTRRGVVRSVADYGAFVDLGGVDGLLHISEMSWTRVKNPQEILQAGQEIDVIIIEIDKDKRRMSLSLKQAGGDPWTLVEQKYPVGTKHQVQIRNLQDFGAFAELEPGVEGLIPISEMTWAGRIRHPRDVVATGAMVEVEILTVDSDKRRISLSMKRIEGNPWSNVEQKYLKDQVCQGKVARVAEFGAFITLEPGVDGLVHISELSDQHIKSPRQVVTMGDEVTVKVLNIDAANQRISLTMKGVAPTAEDAPPEPEKKPKQRPRRGGLSDKKGKGWLDLGELKM